MLANESEYARALIYLKAATKRLAEEERRLQQEGFTCAEIKRLLDPARSFYLQTEEEAAEYESRVRQ